MKAHVRGWVARLSCCLLAASCGAVELETALPPRAVEKPKPERQSNADKAEERFKSLSLTIEGLGSDGKVDPEWLAQQLQQVQRLHPEHEAARYNLAVLAARRGQTQQARDAYEELVDDDENFEPAAENLAAYYVDEGDRDEAIEVYRRLIKNNPKNVTSRLALARLVLRDKQYDEVITLCRKALQRQADAIEAFRLLAAAYIAKGNTRMAELIIGRGFKVDPKDVELHTMLAEIILLRGDLTAGISKLKEIVALDNKNLKVRAQLADIAISFRDFGNAAQQFEAILKERPNDIAVKVGLGVSYKGMGRYKEAKQKYQDVLGSQPAHVEALWNLAVLYHRHLDEYEPAIATYKKFAAAAPGDPKANRVDKLVAEIQKARSDIAAAKAREERERQKVEAIGQACAAIQKGKKANAEKIGNENERIEVSWQLLVDAQASVGGGDLQGAEGLVACAFGILPDTPRTKTDACAPMRVHWTKVIFETVGDLEGALVQVRLALKCDPDNPDAQLIAQQLQEMIAQQAANPPAEQPAAPGGK